MSDVFITGGFRLGKTNQNVDLIAELDKYVDWLCKQAEDNLSLDGVSLVVAGNFFDTKRALTIAQYHKANDIINRLDNSFEMVFFLVGDRDIPGRKNEGETLYDFFEFGHQDLHVIKKFTRIPVGSKSIDLVPFGEEREEWTAEKGDLFVNGGNNSFGSPFQMSWEDANVIGGYVHVTEDRNDRVFYPRKIFRKVDLKDGKIEGKNPIKWLSDNKKDLEGTCLEVVVALDTDKTLYSKFVGVLGTVKLADVKLTETFSFTSDKPMSSSRPDFAESLKPLLDRDGAKTKLEAIIAKLGG
ncbi:DNA repair exonuclease subunit 1 protein [Rhizobium phage RHph_N34]|uniref:DNA repair exonuclease subunit 1 protein n=1 Tax=Rhizobium phage RHph_N34 TaxID=2509586 RepID=A0A7S5RA54_9CAUD|nr:DNA repair exonuclease subunit 1 protein [Rhizobium phage RHph_N34]QIG73925.1 DNA repair exonuclease subunit 1 protein [Rhizobium phage RHph_N34]